MAEKELLYLEDIYNHEKLIVCILKDFSKKFKCKKYVTLVKSHLTKYETLLKKIEKLMEEKSNE